MQFTVQLQGKTCIFRGMETPEALQQRVRRDQQVHARLRLASMRLADAERERLWGIVAAKEGGLIPADRACHQLEFDPDSSVAPGGRDACDPRVA